jgi:hypothetical protein
LRTVGVKALRLAFVFHDGHGSTRIGLLIDQSKGASVDQFDLHERTETLKNEHYIHSSPLSKISRQIMTHSSTHLSLFFWQFLDGFFGIQPIGTARCHAG